MQTITDNFTNGSLNNELWDSIMGGDIKTGGWSDIDGYTLTFDDEHEYERYALTRSLNITADSSISFDLILGNGNNGGEAVDSGEHVDLEYSIDGGNFTLINRYTPTTVDFSNDYASFTTVEPSIPVEAQTSNVQFRWIQHTHDGLNKDSWAIKNVMITHNTEITDSNNVENTNNTNNTNNTDSNNVDTNVENTNNTEITDNNIHDIVRYWFRSDSRQSIEEIHGPIEDWDVSQVTDFSYLFYGATNFTADLSGWDVSSGTNFNGMFKNATNFNAAIGNWNVSSGTNFSEMFNGATNFNQYIGYWNVSSDSNSTGMFTNATKMLDMGFSETPTTNETDEFNKTRLTNDNIRSAAQSGNFTFTGSYGPIEHWDVVK